MIGISLFGMSYINGYGISYWKTLGMSYFKRKPAQKRYRRVKKRSLSRAKEYDFTKPKILEPVSGVEAQMEIGEEENGYYVENHKKQKVRVKGKKFRSAGQVAELPSSVQGSNRASFGFKMPKEFEPMATVYSIVSGHKPVSAAMRTYENLSETDSETESVVYNKIRSRVRVRAKK